MRLARLLVGLASLACATAPPPAAPPSATPISALAHGAELLERGQHQAFLDELFLPSELAVMKQTGRYQGILEHLRGAEGPQVAAMLRRASGRFPRVRGDGALVFDGSEDGKPLTFTSYDVALVSREGRWYITQHPAEVPASPPVLFVRIPRSEVPTFRGKGYQEILDQLMRSRALGRVTGSGGGDDGEGRPYVGIDVEVTDVATALPLLRAKLRALGAPRGTVIVEGRGVGAAIATGLAGPTRTHAVW